MTVRILAVCGNGQGSSMIMKMKVDQFLTQSNIDHTVNSCAVGEYKSELSGADIIIASTHIAGEITVTGNKYVVGVRNMLSPADFGPKLLEVIKEHFPLGSEDDAVRAQGLEIMRKAIQFAQDVGIRVIQLAGYDVYYQEANNETRRRFRDGLKESVEMASRAQVTLAMEIMDYPLMNSISKALGYAHYLNNPWFQLYPDIGNLSAWDNDVQMELQAGIGHIVAVHVKDTKPGVFKNVPFGEGVVDFERCFETLKQSGYCGPYLIEMWSETAEDPAAEVAKAGMVEAA